MLPESLRILVVEDDFSVAGLVTRVLQRAGHVATVMSDAESALGHFERESADLLMVDKHLPRMNGTELVKRMRALKPELPVVLMTAVPEKEAGSLALIDAYLGKPFTELREIERAVERARESRANAIERDRIRRQLAEISLSLAKP